MNVTEKAEIMVPDSKRSTQSDQAYNRCKEVIFDSQQVELKFLRPLYPCAGLSRKIAMLHFRECRHSELGVFLAEIKVKSIVLKIASEREN